MRVVIVGSGGREHALADALGRSAEVRVTPGNQGIAGSLDTPPEEIDEGPVKADPAPAEHGGVV